ncbi:MAG TPA: hypothetical protein VNB49_07275 [Candidatus Dormibacteraeota bacterium]|nr:hypothetical protein [Candidatus Dormibacteraeota bacterium]
MMRTQKERRIHLFLKALIAMALSAAPAFAQPPQPPSAETDRSNAQSGETKKNQEPKKPETAGDAAQRGAVNTSGTSKDRLFFTLPNFLTLENANQVPPLTAGQKFKVVARSSFDYVQYPWYGFLAGISQAENSEAGYGQGAQGYGKRFGAATADGTIENFMTSAVLPSLLRQDPRFFQSGYGGFKRRTWYAFTRIIVTRGDNGKAQPNYSEVFGSALSSAISTYSYHPYADKTVANTAKVWGTQVGYDSLTYVVKEFWPDIRRKLRKKKE